VRQLAGIFLFVLILVAVSPAQAAYKSSPPPAAFSGTYSVTFHVTNVKNFKPTRWVYNLRKACAAPCKLIAFRQRLVSEKAWRSFILIYNWNGSSYAVHPRTQRSIADCANRAGKSIRRGYDVVSTQSIRPAKSINGRVVRFTGTGKDVYKPNAVGRRNGCVTGTYVFAFTGSTA
jgi:hypothetical protein